MMYSKACEHAIKAMIFIATRSLQGERVKISDIAAYTDVPASFTVKLLGLLSKHGYIESFKGPIGGFSMNFSQMEKTSMKDVVLVIDGNQLFEGCALGLKECNSLRPCPMHEHFLKLRNQWDSMLSSTNFKTLAEEMLSGHTVLRR